MKKLLVTQGHSALKHFFLSKQRNSRVDDHEKYDDAKSCHLWASRDHLKYEVFQTILLKYVKNV